MNPIQLLQFIQNVARQANVSYEVHAQVDKAIQELKVLLTPKPETKSTE